MTAPRAELDTLSLSPSASRTDLPARFGKYKLLQVLGTGASGTVYLAEDTLLDRALALKVLDRRSNDLPQDRERFVREARTATKLTHARTVEVYEVNETEGAPYIAMEWMRGGSAQQATDERGPIPWREATAWMLDACAAVAALHEAGLLHRDIKPGNLLLDDAGRIKLSDFGLVRPTGGSNPLTTLNGRPKGTPSFMSPEQCRTETLDECSDVYSLGATYFALLAGHPPFQSENPLAVMFAHCSSPAPRAGDAIPDLPAGCDEVIQRAMAKNPAKRFASARELAQALEALAGDAHPAPARRARPKRRRRLAAVAALACFAVAGATWLTRSRDPREAALEVAPRAQLATTDKSATAVAPPLDIEKSDAKSVAVAAATPNETTPVETTPDETVLAETTTGAADAAPRDPSFPSLIKLGSHRGQLTDMEFLAKGERLLAVGSGGALAVWDVAKRGKMLQRLVEADPPTTKLYALGYVPQRNLVITGGDSQELVCWSLDSGQVTARAPHVHGTVRSIDVGWDGKAFVTGGDLGWNQWQLTPQGELVDQGEVSPGLVLVHTVRYSTIQQVLAAASGNGHLSLRALNNPERSTSWSTDDQVLAFAFCHTRCEFAYATRRGELNTGASSPRLKPKKLARAGELAPIALEFAPNRRLLAVGEEQGRVTCFDLETGEQHRFSTGRKAAITALRFSPDGDRLALGNATGEILIAELPLDKFSPPTPNSELLADQLANNLTATEGVSQAASALRSLLAPKPRGEGKP